MKGWFSKAQSFNCLKIITLKRVEQNWQSWGRHRHSHNATWRVHASLHTEQKNEQLQREPHPHGHAAACAQHFCRTTANAFFCRAEPSGSWEHPSHDASLTEWILNLPSHTHSITRKNKAGIQHQKHPPPQQLRLNISSSAISKLPCKR